MILRGVSATDTPPALSIYICQNQLAVGDQLSPHVEGRPSLRHLRNRLRDQDEFSSDGEEVYQQSHPYLITPELYIVLVSGNTVRGRYELEHYDEG